MQEHKERTRTKTKAELREEAMAAERLEQADQLKQQGNEAFKQGKHLDSTELYSNALQFADKPELKTVCFRQDAVSNSMCMASLCALRTRLSSCAKAAMHS